MASPVVDFFGVEAAGGIVLVVAAAAAMAWANSPWSGSYEDFWTTEITLRWGDFELGEDLRHWVNDGLMVLFFFVVGLEIKNELINGGLSGVRRATVPVAAAVGGMIVPALLYLAVNIQGEALEGWGIPIATDIAFALGVLALLGNKIPQQLKVFLLGLAIVDDIGAILVIAVFYTENLSLTWMALAVSLLGVVAVLRSLRVWYVPVYVLVGFGVWLATYNSGIHATIAGVALGLLAPARPLLSRNDADSVAGEIAAQDGEADEVREATFLLRESIPITERLRDDLHPWTSYLVIPLFALANAGVTIDQPAIEATAGSAVALGIALGLVIGKPLGVVGACWLLVRITSLSLPSNVSWRQIAGVGAIAGVGFTMSLFIAGLAFRDQGTAFEEAKLAIFAASIVAAVMGTLILRRE